MRGRRATPGRLALSRKALVSKPLAPMPNMAPLLLGEDVGEVWDIDER